MRPLFSFPGIFHIGGGISKWLKTRFTDEFSCDSFSYPPATLYQEDLLFMHRSEGVETIV